MKCANYSCKAICMCKELSVHRVNNRRNSSSMGLLLFPKMK